MLEYTGWGRLGRDTLLYVAGGSPHPFWVQTSHCSCLDTAMPLSVTLMGTLQVSLTDWVAHFPQEKIPTPPAEDGAHLRRPPAGDQW